jgi:hypothetical protein
MKLWLDGIVKGFSASRIQQDGLMKEIKQSIKMAKRAFENVSHFKYLRTTVTNQNWIQEEIKRRLNSGNA